MNFRKVLFCLVIVSSSLRAELTELFTCFEADEPIKHQVNLSSGVLQSFLIDDAEEWRPTQDGKHKITLHQGVLNSLATEPVMQYTFVFSNKSVIYINHVNSAPEGSGSIVKNNDVQKVIPFRACAYERIDEEENLLFELLGI